MMCTIPEKNTAKIEFYPEFVMILRCNSICKIPFHYFFNLEAKMYTGFEGTKFELGRIENVLNTI